MALSESGPLDRQQLAMALGAPEGCSKESSSLMQSRVETMSPEGGGTFTGLAARSNVMGFPCLGTH
jgi:hypothetical protein